MRDVADYVDFPFCGKGTEKRNVVENIHFALKWFYGGKEPCLVEPD